VTTRETRGEKVTERPKVGVPKKLRALLEPIGDVYLAKKNVKKNHDVKAIAASLEEFGWHHAVIATKRGEVIIGNGTLKAAQHLGLDRVPVLHVPDSKKQAIRRMVADNRASELSEWDLDVLGGYEDLLDGMVDGYNLSGFFDHPPFEPMDKDKLVTFEASSLTRCPKCGHEFEKA
jgi:hypothetical protein